MRPTLTHERIIGPNYYLKICVSIGTGVESSTRAVKCSNTNMPPILIQFDSNQFFL